VDVPADDRPDAELVTELVATPALPQPGDGQTPDDGDDVLAAFVATVATRFGTGRTPRDKLWSPGPVPSSRFW
jgi:hypothetical protein